MYRQVLAVALLTVFVKAEFSVIKGRLEQGPPPFYEKARTARYLVHNTNWTIIGTTSTITEIKGRPFTNVKSFCDGPVENATGTPYFYSFAGDASMKDIVQGGSAVTMTVSEALTSYCVTTSMDEQDPRCARLTLSGNMVNVTGDEKDFALNALFARHPAMKSWPSSHNFYPTKLKIDFIWLIDYFGGATRITTADYYAAKP